MSFEGGRHVCQTSVERDMGTRKLRATGKCAILLLWTVRLIEFD